MKNKRPRLQVIKYLTIDFCAALLAWILFYIFRKESVDPGLNALDIITSGEQTLILGILFIPLFWLLIYYVAGEYHDIYHKSRLQELGRTLFITTLGLVIIFFILILDDVIFTYQSYYWSFTYLWLWQFGLTYTGRVILTTSTIKKIRNKKIGFNTLIIGSNEQALQLYQDLESKPKSAGWHFVGFVTVNGSTPAPLDQHLPYLGKLDSLIEIVNQEKIEEVIIAIEPSERTKIQQIMVKVKATNVLIKAIPDVLDIISGKVKMASIFGIPFIELSHELMPAWQMNVKRVMDVVVSAIALILLSPFLLFFAIGVKFSSPGPVFYSHQRIGRYGKPFSIYKFRSMYVDAEKNGPALSSKTDNRITPFGRYLRKMRFDELPQFYNVLIGDMSLVGPRPERLYYIDQIVQRAPHYYAVFKVRPGITSWGQVKFGYAENVNEMIERLKYDLIYLENMSLYVDIKILIYTIKTVFEGSGQ